MEKSFLNFSAAHPEWAPADAAGSLYLSRIAAQRQRGYGAALAQSQALARRRRPDPTAAAGPEAAVGPAGLEQSAMFASALGPGLARTVVLPGEMTAPAPAPVPAPVRIPAADRTPDEGIGSALGESYADGADAPVPALDEDDGLADGGVLGMLAQVYGTRARAQGPGRVIQ
jgi:autophagy-related protein 9